MYKEENNDDYSKVCVLKKYIDVSLLRVFPFISIGFNMLTEVLFWVHDQSREARLKSNPTLDIHLSFLTVTLSCSLCVVYF